MRETAKRVVDKREGESWRFKSMIFNSWMKNLIHSFEAREVISIMPYKNLQGDLMIRVTYTKDKLQPAYFTIPSNLDLNPSDWEYLKEQIKENIPSHAA